MLGKVISEDECTWKQITHYSILAERFVLLPLLINIRSLLILGLFNIRFSY